MLTLRAPDAGQCTTNAGVPFCEPLKQVRTGVDVSQYANSHSPVSGTLPGEDIDGFFERTLNSLRAQSRQDRIKAASNRSGSSRKWIQMTEEAEKLGKRLSSDPRVLYFEFNHDHEELSVKVVNPVGRSHAYFVLSRHDPDTLELSPMDCVWLRQIGEPDVIVEEPMDALRELAVRIARLLL